MVIGLFLIIFAVLGIVAVFVLKSPKLLNYLFIFQLVLSLLLVILAVSVIDPRQFLRELEKAKTKAVEDTNDLDKIQSSFKCCTQVLLDNSFQKSVKVYKSCCDSSQLKYEKDGEEEGVCFSDKAYENCFGKFLNKQKGFRAWTVILLTLMIIFQLLLSFSLYNSQGEL